MAEGFAGRRSTLAVKCTENIRTESSCFLCTVGYHSDSPILKHCVKQDKSNKVAVIVFQD